MDAKEAEELAEDYDPDTAIYKDFPSRSTIETGVSMLSYFEGKYACSGVCQPALFYYSLDLQEGVPQMTCLANLKEEIGDELSYLGGAALVCGIIMFFTWLCQYALWRKYDDESDDKDKGFDNRN